MPGSTSNAPITVGGVHNFRSTEGYRAGEGVVRPGRLFRSGSLQAITDAGQQVVSDLGVRTIVDLRSEPERTGWPCRVWSGVRVAARPVLASTQADTEDDDLQDVYRGIVTERGPDIAAAVRTVLDAGDEGVVVNCYAGKDRTGIVVAVTLLAAGVDRDAVVADYAASAQNLAGEWAEAMVARLTGDDSPPAAGLIDEITASPPETMITTIEQLDRLYGGAAGLLLANGFTGADLERLRRTLIAE